jgi:membrane protease YdiL (CAAX protease family)
MIKNRIEITGGTKRIAWKILYFPLTRIVVESLVLLVVGLVVNSILIKPLIGMLGVEYATARTLRFGLNIVVLIVAYRYLIGFYEKRESTELSSNNSIKEIVLGLSLGTFSMSLVILTLNIMGYCELVSISNQRLIFLYPLVYLCFVGTTEEILFRGILFRISEESLGTTIALITSSLVFAVLHLTSEGANIMTVFFCTIWAAFMCTTYCLTRRLWFPIFFHGGWNFAMALFGTAVSGSLEFLPYSLFISELHGPEFLVGGRFGPENSIISIVVCMILFIAFYTSHEVQSHVVNG